MMIQIIQKLARIPIIWSLLTYIHIGWSLSLARFYLTMRFLTCIYMFCLGIQLCPSFPRLVFG